MSILTGKQVVSRLPGSWQRCLRRAHYLRKLRRASLDDQADLGVLGELVKPGDTVFDIGANFGLYTRFLSEAVGPRGRVFAFEPVPAMFSVLAHNVRKLRLGNVECVNAALSDAPGTFRMRIPRWPDGTLNYYEASVLPAGDLADLPAAAEVEVEALTLDAFRAQRALERIDFIKCDVEGHEAAVLRGAEEALKSCRPPLLLEVNDSLSGSERGRKLAEAVRALGYAVHVFDGGAVLPWREGDDRVNYVLVPDAEEGAPVAPPV